MGYEWKEGRLYRNDVATDWRLRETADDGWCATHPATSTHAEACYYDDTEAEVQAMVEGLETHRVLARLRARRKEGA